MAYSGFPIFKDCIWYFLNSQLFLFLYMHEKLILFWVERKLMFWSDYKNPKRVTSGKAKRSKFILIRSGPRDLLLIYHIDGRITDLENVNLWFAA